MSFQENSEEDTEGDESFVSAEAEEASEEMLPDPEYVETNAEKDLEESNKDDVVNDATKDVEDVVSEEAGEALEAGIGSEEEETETELTIAAVESAVNQSVESVENEKESLDEVGSSEENEEAMNVDQADKEENEAIKTPSPKKVHFSDQVCFIQHYIVSFIFGELNLK